MCTFFSSGGIEIRQLSTTVIPKRKDVKDPVLHKFHFVPNETYLSVEESISVNLQLILDNCYRLQVKIYELIEGTSKDNLCPLGPHMFKVLTDIPFIQPDIRLLTSMKLEIPNVTLENKSLKNISDAFVMAGHCLVTRQEVSQSKCNFLVVDFIIPFCNYCFISNVVSPCDLLYFFSKIWIQ